MSIVDPPPLPLQLSRLLGMSRSGPHRLARMSVTPRHTPNETGPQHHPAQQATDNECALRNVVKVPHQEMHGDYSVILRYEKSP